MLIHILNHYFPHPWRAWFAENETLAPVAMDIIDSALKEKLFPWTEKYRMIYFAWHIARMMFKGKFTVELVFNGPIFKADNGSLFYN